jgi:Carboxypeptidase regulatory-like domain/TonB dependent receptor
MKKTLQTFAFLAMPVLFSASVAKAQLAGTIRGSVTDPSAAVVPGATVQLNGNGVTRSAKSDGQGKFTLTVPAGKYAVRADAKGFVTFLQPAIEVVGGQASPLDIALQIAAEAQQVSVSDQAAGQVSVDPSSNVGALVLKNEDLESLPDDPDDLQADLQALAGPAAGPNGAQFFVDGFSGGQLPPKSSIREIRINSNPFSSEFDRPGFGRIEILTKPGTDTFHGGVFANFGDKIFDTRNPFLATEPGYTTKMLGANLGGPLSKKASFFLDFNRRQIDDNSLIKAQVLDSSFNEVPYTSAYSTPNRFWLVSPRIDYQINATNTLVMRWNHIDSSNTGGVGSFSLPTQTTLTNMKNNQVQITETMIVGTKAVDETRFQFTDSHSSQTGVGNSSIPGIDVSSSFNSGGSPFTSNYTFSKGFEVQNIATITQGTHTLKVGGRLRQNTLNSQSTSNFNGSYLFSLNTLNGIPTCLAGYTNPTSLDLYRETQLLLSQGVPISTVEAQGCGPTQFTLNAGQPLESVSQYDLGLFVQDDWRFRPNLTISLGLRYETQTNIHDHEDWAPRLAIAWAPGAKKGATSKTVIRTGWGMFYDRFDDSNLLQALRYNGTTQESYQLTASPTLPLSYYPNIAPLSSLATGLTQQNIYRIDPTVRAPYMMQAALGVERALPARTSLAVNLINSRGVHTLRTRDINAPNPATYTGIGTPVLPFPGIGPIYQYETTGVYKQTQAIVNMNTRFNTRFSLSGYYALGFAHGNSSGLPMDQYNTALDYGRTAFDVRHRAFIGGNMNLKWGISASPFITMSSGSPFNITTGNQFDGDGIFNERPSFATSSTNPIYLKTTKYGNFDLNPAANATLIPINYGEGPPQFSANLRISRTWSFGEKAAPNGLPDGMGRGMGGPGGPGGGGPPPGGGGGGRGGPGGGGGGFGGGMGGMMGGMGGGGAAGKKYSLNASVNARNVFNVVNLAAPNGTLTSPFFGQSTSLAGGGGGPFGGGGNAAGNRRIEFQLRLSF